ncbi:MAG: hypothetical protein JNK11_18355 [Alphaproteobacteria bacterium]|nr:hypothetical protein [Alphaproteobacteria bacterium]
MAISPVTSALFPTTSQTSTATEQEKAKQTLDSALKPGNPTGSKAQLQALNTSLLFGGLTGNSNPFSLLPAPEGLSALAAYAATAQYNAALTIQQILAAQSQKPVALELDGGLVAQITTEAEAGDYKIAYDGSSRVFTLTDAEGNAETAKAYGLNVDFGKGISFKLTSGFDPASDLAAQAFEVSKAADTTA